MQQQRSAVIAVTVLHTPAPGQKHPGFLHHDCPVTVTGDTYARRRRPRLVGGAGVRLRPTDLHDINRSKEN
jgi:hypothetical protein